ncbi:hypothetical protein [Hufsiella arboris]|nr:hypothetical protein [Hufsiella arboris]
MAINKEKLVLWFKRLGFAGFMFFLIKGLIWLVIFYFIGSKVAGK